MPGSATDQLKALVEAAEREARESREGLERVGERADELARRLDELTAGVAEALAALREEVAALRADSTAEPKAGDDELSLKARRLKRDIAKKQSAEAEAAS